MRKLMFILLISVAGSYLSAQSFEGVLKIDYRDEAGHKSAADVYVKGDKFYIKKVYGGCERYDSYIYDTKMHSLTCLVFQNPKTALKLNIDQIMDIYETKQLKPGFKLHFAQTYTATGAVKKMDDIKVGQKKAEDANHTYEIWVADQHINYSLLIPVLRLTGFWGEVEDEDNTIMEAHVISKTSKSASETSIIAAKEKIDDVLFTIPSAFQQVDMDKFLTNEAKSPRFAELVKAFSGF